MLHTEWPFHYLNGYFLTIPYEFFSLTQQPHLPTAPSLSEGNTCLIYKSAKFPPFSSWSVVCMLYLICNRYLISCHTRIALFHFTICRGREFHTRVLFLPYCNTKKLPLTFSSCILWYTKGARILTPCFTLYFSILFLTFSRYRFLSCTLLILFRYRLLFCILLILSRYRSFSDAPSKCSK